MPEVSQDAFELANPLKVARNNTMMRARANSHGKDRLQFPFTSGIQNADMLSDKRELAHR